MSLAMANCQPVQAMTMYVRGYDLELLRVVARSQTEYRLQGLVLIGFSGMEFCKDGEGGEPTKANGTRRGEYSRVANIPTNRTVLVLWIDSKAYCNRGNNWMYG